MSWPVLLNKNAGLMERDGPAGEDDDRPGPRERPTQSQDVDRDTVDFDRLTGFLRRRGWWPERTPTSASVGGDHRPPFGSGPRSDARRRPPGAASGRSPAEVADDAPISPDRRARLLVAGASLTYVVLFAAWTVRNHDGLGTQAFDLGIYDQGLWLLSRFHAPFVTIMGRNLFGDHTSFALLPLVPFYWIRPSAKVLLVAQAFAVGTSAVPAFLLAREKLRNERLAAFLAVAFLLQPVLGWTNLEQFHPDVLEIPLVLFAAYFMARERWTTFLLVLGALLLVKEDAVLAALGFGTYIAWKHDRRVGLLTCAASVLYAGAAFWVFLPALNGVGTLNGWRIPFGGPLGFIRTAALHPGRVISYVFVEDRMWYVWQLFAPVALVALLAPSALLIAAMPLGANAVSTFLYQYNIHYHYSTMVAPLIMVATILGIADFGRTMNERRNLVLLVLGAAVVTAHLWGPTPIGRDEFSPANPHSAQAASVREAIRMVPGQDSISAMYNWVPQVDHRKEVYVFPTPWKAAYWGTFTQEGQRLPIADRVEWVLLPTQLDPEPKAVLDTIRSDFESVYEKDGVMLLHRRGAT